MTGVTEHQDAAAEIFERSQEILDDQPWLSQEQAKNVARREMAARQ